MRDDWTLFQITESVIQVGTKERLRRPLWEKAIVDAEELLKTKRMSLLQRKAIEADIKRCRLATKSPTCDCRSRSPPSGDLRPRLVQGAGEGGLFDPGAIEAPQGVWGGAGLTVAQEYVDVETAKQTGRAAFGEMVAYLKAHPSVRVMLVEKTDRLYRNLKDWVTVDELDVEISGPALMLPK